MAAPGAQMIDDRAQAERHAPASTPPVTGDRRRAITSSPVAMLHHQIETAALRGFFEKDAPRRWQGPRRHAAIVVVAAGGVWTAIFAIVWAGSH